MKSLSMKRLVGQLRSAELAAAGTDATDGQLLAQFIGQQNEIAFEALMKRHGPMVLGVCRRILGNAHDADDAFQASFLILVHKAASLKSCELVGNWLYGVAYRTALAARAARARRRSKEKQVMEMPEPAVAPPDDWSEWRPLLDQELSQLGNVYREAIVLCDLEGKTRKEAARQLGIPESTFSGRLTTARRQLAKRFKRHGLTLSGGAMATALAQDAAWACVPIPLVVSTTKAASTVAAGGAVAGVVSSSVAALTERGLKAMFMTKVKTLSAVVILGAGILAASIAIGSVVVGQTLTASAGAKVVEKEDPVPKVAALPTMLGDCGFWDARTPEGKTDIPKLVKTLKDMQVKDYMHMVPKDPSAWKDFQAMAPEFQKADIRLWLYLLPPSEGGSAPFGIDYVRWARECASIAKKYPIVKGICIHDWSRNTGKFTVEYCKEMSDEAQKIAPQLRLLVWCYIGHRPLLEPYVKAQAIGGVIFPYYHPSWKPYLDSTQLYTYIAGLRANIDSWSGKAGRVPIVPMIFASSLNYDGFPTKAPTEVSVRTGLGVALEATRLGLADGVVTYRLPKEDPKFVKAMAEVFNAWELKQAIDIPLPNGLPWAPTLPGKPRLEEDAAGAVDGYIHGKPFYGFRTAVEEKPWWQVDLGDPLPLSRMQIFCQESEENYTIFRVQAGRLKKESLPAKVKISPGITVLVSDDGKAFKEVFHHKGDFRALPHGVLPMGLNGVRARFVRLQLPDRNDFYLQEVSIYQVGDDKKNIALGKPATQSSLSEFSVRHPLGIPTVQRILDWDRKETSK